NSSASPLIRSPEVAVSAIVNSTLTVAAGPYPSPSRRERFGSDPIEKARDALEQIAEPPEGPDVAVVGRGLRQAEALGGLAVAQFLEMPQGQDLATHRVHAVEHGLELELPLGAHGGVAGGGEPPQQLRRQRDGAGLRQGAAVERHLAAGVAH